LAYGELVFLPVTWGDLAVEHLRTAIDDFARRQRRFGGVD
jgi:undecaprenyl diphosphate synthase